MFINLLQIFYFCCRSLRSSLFIKHFYYSLSISFFHFWFQVKYRVAWTKNEERIKQREQAAIEKERALYAQIDWHDFVVVETVDFAPDERGKLCTM